MPFCTRNACGIPAGMCIDIPSAESVPLAAVEPGAHPFARRSRRLLVDDRAAELQRAFAALHVHEIDNVVVLLRKTVGVPIQISDAMMAEVGEGFGAKSDRRLLFFESATSRRFSSSSFPQRKPGLMPRIRERCSRRDG